jgi:uncharacterized protein involved in type VI secretion and phage assembly
MDEARLMELLEHVRGRHYGKYRGTVTEVDAPTMRIKAKVPSVLPGQTSGWCMACVPYAGPSVGMAFLPEVGAGVWIEFEAGDVSKPIWTGCYWRDGETPDGVEAAIKVLTTKSGHRLEFDDDGKKLTIKDGNNNTITLEQDTATISHGSKKVVLNNQKVSINGSNLEVE